MAPGTGQCATQQPANQHSSGYNTIGGLPFSGLGTSTCVLHVSTHILQPVQISGSISTTLPGVGGLGIIYALLLIIICLCCGEQQGDLIRLVAYIHSLETRMLLVILLISWSVRWKEPIVEWQLPNLDLFILQLDGNELILTCALTRVGSWHKPLTIHSL
jgi:hypothetical protein